jgi:hypothetical protein
MKNIKVKLLLLVGGVMALFQSCDTAKKIEASHVNDLRAPAFPLISIDPYTSVWSFNDNLYDSPTKHWTGKDQSIVGVLNVDGKDYRFMGNTSDNRYEETAVQKNVNVLPTQTFYTFDCGPVALDVIFTAPLLLDNLERVSTPINFITWQVNSNDERSHKVAIRFEASSDLAVDNPEQEVVSSKESGNGIGYLKTGTVDQKILGKSGDNVRIDWGYFYLAAPESKNVTMDIDGNKQLIYENNLGKVANKPNTGFIMVGYDDLYSIQYFDDNRQAYWKHDGKKTIQQAFEEYANDYDNIITDCGNFNKKMMDDAISAGGKEYADLCALAYRQSIAAHKLTTDSDGNLLFLSKENFSNGCIGTVDVTYPSSPLFLLYNPDLLKGMLTPIFYYSESGRYTKPYAAHDLGTYPLANGSNWEEGMPVEECGNMLIMTSAIALRDGNADFAKAHWPTLTTWVNYLVDNGLDPDNQLCTDDFAGHLAHNVNLSAKAIIGIGGYAMLADMLGDKETAEKHIAIAKDMAKKWEEMANCGDHYSLTFDKHDTWSQKYNLIWDKVLGLNLFPQDIMEKEVAYYINIMQPYGIPLDCRRTYTKSDWIHWSACLTDNEDNFHALMSPLYKFVNETPDRVPLSDWHETTNGKSINFRARSVVGAYFMKMLQKDMKN